jgi:hypothetical protein
MDIFTAKRSTKSEEFFFIRRNRRELNPGTSTPVHFFSQEKGAGDEAIKNKLMTLFSAV